LEEEIFNLKEELKFLGMTQKDFAKHLEKSTNTVNRWAKGEIPIPKVVRLYIEAYKKAKLYDEITFKMTKYTK
jgi:transcriptional regulator with XRE-family HTH domain